MTIDTLVEDIESLLVNGIELSDEQAQVFGNRMASLIKTRLVREARPGTLRMSNLGKPDRQLWYEVNEPNGTKLHPHSYMKFLYGDIIEELVLFLAELSGHKVEGTQDEMHLHGILGHRDAVIDGMIVDVKSTSPYSYKKFQDHLTHDKDAFGYLSQINNYIVASEDDPLVTNKEEGAFLVNNKVTGALLLDKHKKSIVPMDEIIKHKKEVVSLPEPPEERCYEPEPMGKSGNLKLGVNCSYCDHKFKCWDGLRGFAYSTGPVYLTHIIDEPRVPEIKGDNMDDET